METLDLHRIGRRALLTGTSLALTLGGTSAMAGDTTELREQGSFDGAIHPKTSLVEDLVPIGGGIIQLGPHGILDVDHPDAVLSGEEEFSGDRSSETIQRLPHGILDVDHPDAVLSGEEEFSGDRSSDTIQLIPQGILDVDRPANEIPRVRPEGILVEEPEFRESEDDVASAPVGAVTPSDFEIRAFPNPSFGPVAIEAGSTRLAVDVYDVSGRKVVSLTGASGRTAWDGRDARGQVVTSGVYFARVSAPQEGIQKTVRLVRN